MATGSVALLADTIHNFSDALTADPAVHRLPAEPPAANRRYTYGYGRAEDLAGVFVIAMIALSAVIAAYEAIDRLIHPRPLDQRRLAVRRRADRLRRQRARRPLPDPGRATRSGRRRWKPTATTPAPTASPRWRSSLGAVGAWLGFERADPIVGLAISIAIFAVLRGAARQICHRLMDAVDPEIIDVDRAHRRPRRRRAAGRRPVQARWVGHRLAASIAIVVDEDLSVRQGHDVAEAVRHDLLHSVRHLDDVDVHVDPCGHHGTDPHANANHHA